MDINASRGMQAGATEDKIREIESAVTSTLYDDRERAAIEYAETMTITGRKVSDDLFARIRGHFSEAQVVELTAAVALENFRSKFNVALGIEAQGFCVIKSPT
jgi:alkylhydroperoxidase family enzyme